MTRLRSILLVALCAVGLSLLAACKAGDCGCPNVHDTSAVRLGQHA